MKKSAYDYDNARLVEALRNAAQEAGAANKERFAYVEFRTATYFAGVVLARLEGLKPPFNEGDEVRPKSRRKGLMRGSWVVERAVYRRDGTWHLVFRGLCDQAYPPEDFEKISDQRLA